MHSKVVLFDLENNTPTANLLRNIVEHDSILYLFNCRGTFEYALEDLTEFASWIASGQVVILETPKAAKKEFEYAVVVGQLMALLEPDTHVDVISAMDSSDMLMLMLQGSNIHSRLIQIEESLSEKAQSKFQIPQIDKILQNPDLQLVKKYCDALARMEGKPNTIEKLKNSITNILQLNSDIVQKMVGMLISLKIVKKHDEKIEFRKKVLKQWFQIDLNQKYTSNYEEQELSVQQPLKLDQKQIEKISSLENAQQGLFKNFAQIDPVQMEVAKKLRELKSNKPKDIYALRDLLEQMFPKSDIRLLLKELIEKGYIYWNGHEVLYSHEMFLN